MQAKSLTGEKHYRSGAAKQKSHQKTMIFDFEKLLLGQKIIFRDNKSPLGKANSLRVKV